MPPPAGAVKTLASLGLAAAPRPACDNAVRAPALGGYVALAPVGFVGGSAALHVAGGLERRGRAEGRSTNAAPFVASGAASAWPSQSWIARSGAPAAAIWVPNVWRS